MWPFRRHATTSPGAIQDALHDLAGALKRLREDHEALAAAHERLRGRFYALRGVVPREDAAAPSKTEALRDFFKPGQPTQHQR